MGFDNYRWDCTDWAHCVVKMGKRLLPVRDGYQCIYLSHPILIQSSANGNPHEWVVFPNRRLGTNPRLVINWIECDVRELGDSFMILDGRVGWVSGLPNLEWNDQASLNKTRPSPFLVSKLLAIDKWFFHIGPTRLSSTQQQTSTFLNSHITHTHTWTYRRNLFWS